MRTTSYIQKLIIVLIKLIRALQRLLLQARCVDNDDNTVLTCRWVFGGRCVWRSHCSRYMPECRSVCHWTCHHTPDTWVLGNLASSASMTARRPWPWLLQWRPPLDLLPPPLPLRPGAVPCRGPSLPTVQTAGLPGSAGVAVMTWSHLWTPRRCDKTGENDHSDGRGTLEETLNWSQHQPWASHQLVTETGDIPSCWTPLTRRERYSRCMSLLHNRTATSESKTVHYFTFLNNEA